MSKAEVIDMVVNATEARSIASVASKVVSEIQSFADGHNVASQFDPVRTKHDLVVFLAERAIVDPRQLRVSVLEGGDVQIGDSISGPRVADLFIRFRYREERSELLR